MNNARITRRHCLNLGMLGAASALAACAAPTHASDAEIVQPTPPTKAEAMAKIAPTATAIPKMMPAVTSTPVEDKGPIAPPIASEVWLNTPKGQALTWESLRGQVVAVEFWTLGCINCQHVIPSLVSLYADYKTRGFTILGVHAPEFDYEKKLANVQQAIAQWKIEYPVAIDNDFANWNRYRNRYWPALYLVDKRGLIRHIHIGEGGESETREWIEKLVTE